MTGSTLPLSPTKVGFSTILSAWWFNRLGTPSHFITTRLPTEKLPPETDLEILSGHCMQVIKARPLPIECIVRGYITGSGWKQYQKNNSICGIKLPKGLVTSQQLPEPIFTPSTKAETGHDINISFSKMCQLLVPITHDLEKAAALGQLLLVKSIEIYQWGAQHALNKGIIIADTKFEWGLANGSESVLDLLCRKPFNTHSAQSSHCG